MSLSLAPKPSPSPVILIQIAKIEKSFREMKGILQVGVGGS